MKNLNVLEWVALILTIVGGLNWGLVGFFDWNLVHWVFGDMSIISRVIYAVVGLAAIYIAVAAIQWKKPG